MDIATLGGILLALVSLIVAFSGEGGALGSLVQPTAALIVFGGTIGATVASTTMRQILSVGKYLKVAFFYKGEDPLDIIESLVSLATTARREGILALEEQVESFQDEFLQKGIQSIVDGVDPELVKTMLTTELDYIEERHKAGAKVFEMAGGYAPTLGIIGTVMGLVHVLGNLKNVSALGPQIATAFTATLYGVSSANIIWLPIAYKLKRRNSEEVLTRELMIEGVLSIQAGENPQILRQKLVAFLPPKGRTAKAKASDTEAGEVDAETI